MTSSTTALVESCESANGWSPLQHLCGSVVCRKETLESKLREGHIDWRAENRRSTYEAEHAGVGDKLERDEHTAVSSRSGGIRGFSMFVAGNFLSSASKSMSTASAVCSI